jgi:hypothetical protein
MCDYFNFLLMFYGCSSDDVNVYMQGVVMISHSFGLEFGDQINRYVVLIDKNHNEFDVRVERINGNIFFTRGWADLRDFYEITFGAWVTVVFLGLGRFQIKKRLNSSFCPLTFPKLRF